MVESIPQIATELPGAMIEVLLGGDDSPTRELRAHVAERLRLRVEGELWSARVLHVGAAGLSLAVDHALGEKLNDSAAAALGYELGTCGVAWLPGRVSAAADRANDPVDDSAVVAFTLTPASRAS
jgi:hypothetical protein